MDSFTGPMGVVEQDLVFHHLDVPAPAFELVADEFGGFLVGGGAGDVGFLGEGAEPGAGVLGGGGGDGDGLGAGFGGPGGGGETEQAIRRRLLPQSVKIPQKTQNDDQRKGEAGDRAMKMNPRGNRFLTGGVGGAKITGREAGLGIEEVASAP